jgi:hypothetical protein
MLELARKCTEYGAYTVSDTGQIKGLIYAPFVRFIKEAFHVDAEVVPGMTAHGIAGVLQHAEFLIASLHYWIRWPEREPPTKVDISSWCLKPARIASFSTILLATV